MTEEEKQAQSEEKLADNPEPPRIQFDTLQKDLTQREATCSQKFPEEIKAIQEMIFESMMYGRHISQVKGQRAKAQGKEITGARAFPVFYFYRNAWLLLGAFELCKKGLTSQTITLCRTVVENILEIYYVLFEKDEITQLFYECKLGKLEEGLEKKHEHFSQKIIRRALFSKGKQLEMSEYYGTFSEVSHAGITSAETDSLFSEEDTHDKMELILHLGAANIIAITEAELDVIDKTEKEKMDNIVKKIFAKWGIADLLPDKPELRSKLKITFNNYR